jgi:glyoxylase-like metal-dependent hydrolase (beta-lactamase superfamily II)
MLISERLALVASLQFGIGSRYDCHVYAVRGDDGVVLLDAGCGLATESIVDEVRRCWPDVSIRAIILTHSHADHANGAAKLQARTGCAVFAPDLSLEAVRQGDDFATGLAEAREQGGYPADLRMQPCPQAQPYSDRRAVRICGIDWMPLLVRGHSHDSHCLVTEIDGQRVLFSGDTIFYGAVLGVINREDSGMNGYRTDLPKLGSLRIDALLPGHGLFTLSRGQHHIDKALDLIRRGFLPRQIGQVDLIF